LVYHLQGNVDFASERHDFVCLAYQDIVHENPRLVEAIPI
jgi:hypothetical protein